MAGANTHHHPLVSPLAADFPHRSHHTELVVLEDAPAGLAVSAQYEQCGVRAARRSQSLLLLLPPPPPLLLLCLPGERLR